MAGEAQWAQVEISTTDPATGNPVVLASGHRYVPPAAETLRHDEDGNLIEDGRWLYTWVSVIRAPVWKEWNVKRGM